MAKSRVPSPNEVVKVRRLPSKGEPIVLTGTVTNVTDDEPGGRKVTVRFPATQFQFC